MTALLTIFSAPKPFNNAHISLIQRNAINSWKELGNDVEIALVGGEEGIKDVADELGIMHFAEVKTNHEGTPLISSIFNLGRSLDQSPLLAFINADIILLSDFLAAARLILEKVSKFLIVGQRWDLDVREQIQMNSGWESGLKRSCWKGDACIPQWGVIISSSRGNVTWIFPILRSAEPGGTIG